MKSPEKINSIGANPAIPEESWKIIIADDDRMVQALTVMSLEKLSFEGKPLTLLHAYSGEETLELLKQHPDTALILLDVVMENEMAGLDIAGRIRTELDNQFVQIVLRTGQPGQAPRAKVIQEYEINGYLEKNSTTNQGLQSAVIMSLRYYRNLMIIQKQHREMEKNLAEKMTLLREIHHRVKNNLQILASMADLQIDLSAKPEGVLFLQQFRSRVHAMALAHELLYDNDDFSEMLFGKYLEKLCTTFPKSFDLNQKITLNTSIISDFNIPIDVAIPCGIIVNELITNAYQYAFPGNMKGNITVSLETKSNKALLTIKDTGVGLPEGFDPSRSERLGLLLVSQLAKQLKATLDYKSANGLEWKMTFEIK